MLEGVLGSLHLHLLYPGSLATCSTTTPFLFTIFPSFYTLRFSYPLRRIQPITSPTHSLQHAYPGSISHHHHTISLVSIQHYNHTTIHSLVLFLLLELLVLLLLLFYYNDSFPATRASNKSLLCGSPLGPSHPVSTWTHAQALESIHYRDVSIFRFKTPASQETSREHPGRPRLYFIFRGSLQHSYFLFPPRASTCIVRHTYTYTIIIIINNNRYIPVYYRCTCPASFSPPPSPRHVRPACV